jgi:hypothetical protein
MAFANDPGQPDSLIISLVAAEPYVPSVMLPVYVVTDDPVVEITMPFRWESTDGNIHLAGAYFFNDMMQWDEADFSLNMTENHIVVHGICDVGGDPNPLLNTDYQRQLAFMLRFVIREGAAEQFVPVYTYTDNNYGEPKFKLDDGNSLTPMTVTGGLYYQPISVDDEKNVLPYEISLEPNYPNPFNMDTKISFGLPERTDVSLDVYDILGRKIKNLTAGNLDAGRYTYSWNGIDETGNEVTSGIYFYRLKTADNELTGKMVLLK